MSTRDNYRGVLLGLACGDALGRPVEGQGPEDISRAYGTIRRMEADGVFDAPAGTTTDDTAQAQCLLESVIQSNGFNPEEFAKRLLEWARSDGFGAGRMTMESINKLSNGVPWDQAGKETWKDSDEGANAGNGSVMRCAPLALVYATDTPSDDSLKKASMAQSVITHADSRCVYGSYVLNEVIRGQLSGAVESPLQSALDQIEDEAPKELIEPLRTVPKTPSTDRFGLTPYVVDTLEIALHHGLTASSTADAIIGAVNEGGDADTTGAIAGAIAGARHGASTLPDEWLRSLDRRKKLWQLANQCWESDTNFDVIGVETIEELDVRRSL